MSYFVYGTLRPDCCCWSGVYDNKNFNIFYEKATIKYSKLYMDY
jgi:hypothetical protein